MCIGESQSKRSLQVDINDVDSACADRGRTLPAELWRAISYHLKPRHLYKLLQVGVAMNRMVDVEPYWERIAAHLMWREIELDRRTEYNDWYHLFNLSDGYRDTMDEFLSTKRASFLTSGLVLIRRGLKRECDEDVFESYYERPWRETILLAERFRIEMFIDSDIKERDYVATNAIVCKSMKDVAKRETLRVSHLRKPWERTLMAELCRLDDDRTVNGSAKEYMMNFIVHAIMKVSLSDDVGKCQRDACTQLALNFSNF